MQKGIVVPSSATAQAISHRRTRAAFEIVLLPARGGASGSGAIRIISERKAEPQPTSKQSRGSLRKV